MWRAQEGDGGEEEGDWGKVRRRVGWRPVGAVKVVV